MNAMDAIKILNAHVVNAPEHVCDALELLRRVVKQGNLCADCMYFDCDIYKEPCHTCNGVSEYVHKEYTP